MVAVIEKLLSTNSLKNFKFPDHVGWSIGAADSLRYLVLETHFDNPTQNNSELFSYSTFDS